MTHAEAIAYLATLPPDEREAAEERIAIRVESSIPEARAVVMTAEECRARRG
jgi:hypothetical protein